MTNYDRSFPGEWGVADLGTFTGTGQTGQVIHTGVASGAYAIYSIRTSATEPSVLTLSLQGRMSADMPWVTLTDFTNTLYVNTLDPTGTPVANAGASVFNGASNYRLLPELRAVTSGTWTGTGAVRIWVAWH